MRRHELRQFSSFHFKFNCVCGPASHGDSGPFVEVFMLCYCDLDLKRQGFAMRRSIIHILDMQLKRLRPARFQIRYYRAWRLNYSVHNFIDE